MAMTPLKSLKRFALVLTVLVFSQFIGTFSNLIFGQSDEKLTELSQLKVDNFNLDKALIQCRADLLNTQLTNESNRLTNKQSELRVLLKIELKCKDDENVNLDTKSCEKVKRNEDK